MKIVNIENLTRVNDEAAIALGNFDGVHIAHQKLIESMVEDARNQNIKSSVLLFENHTREITGKKPRLLTKEEDKIKILEDLGVDIVYKMKFSEEIMKLSPEEFVETILIDKLNVKSVTVGFDYRFGHKASGNADKLIDLGEKYNIEVNIIDPIFTDDIISSTRIREYLDNGEIKKANKMLGRNYTINGKVIRGAGRGRNLGFPTANIDIDDEYLIPKFGIYATKVTIDGKSYMAGTNIGITPSFENQEVKLENYIIDFSGDLYGKNIKTEFIEYVREEIKFTQVDDLISQMTKDIEYIKSLDK